MESKSYVERIKTLREMKHLSEAEHVAQEAVTRYPDDWRILFHWASVAGDRNDWREAGFRWIKLVDSSWEKAPTVAFWKIASFFRKSGRIDESTPYIQEGLKRNPEHMGLLLERARLARFVGDFEMSIKLYKNLLDRTKDKKLSNYFRKASATELMNLFGFMGRTADSEEIERNLCLIEPGVNGAQIENIFYRPKQGCDEIRRCLLSLMPKFPNGAGEAWLEAFDHIAESISAIGSTYKPRSIDLPESSLADSNARHGESGSPRILAVSGMGYSGSGALYDFLSDFKQVSFLRGMFRPIGGMYGINKLASTFEDENEFHKRLLYIFFGALLGYIKPSNVGGIYLQEQKKKFAMNEEYGVKLAASAKMYFSEICQEFWDGDLASAFPKLNAEFISRVGSQQSGDIVLCDQLVKLATNPLSHVLRAVANSASGTVPWWRCRAA